MSTDYRLRPAAPEDVPAIAELIRGLAEYEELSSECKTDESRLRDHLFGDTRYAEVILAEVDSQPVGFALFFHSYSTFLSKPGIHLEDLYVKPRFRGNGIGKALLTRITRIAAERGCGRVEWLVLDWNTPSIEFYKSAFGAKPVDGWTVFRLTEDQLSK